MEGTVRKLAILLILAVFVAYLAAAYRGQNRYAVPAYAVETLDILAGATASHWQSPEYASSRHERLVALEKRHLQPVETVRFADGRAVRPDERLHAADFEALVAEGTTRLTVRDPAALQSFADRKLALREPLALPAAEGGASDELEAGTVLTKPVLDRLQDAGVTEVRVVGKGDVVGVNATVFMVILIFTGMTLALIELFWTPVTALLDQRRREIAQGQAAAKENQAEAARLEEERTASLRAIHQECQATIAAGRQRAIKESEELFRQMRIRMRTTRDNAAETLQREVAQAEAALEKEIPALADAVVQAVLPKAKS